MDEKVISNVSDLTPIADALRSTTGSTKTYSVPELTVAAVNAISSGGGSVAIDTTLTQSGQAADAYVVGQILAEKADTSYVDDTIAAIDYPVDSVNGKTGAVVLSASDVGADISGSANAALTNAKEYIDTEISAIPQADWNENDETSPAYVKNRTHWAKGSMKELYPEMLLTPMAPDEPVAPIVTAPTNMPVIGDTAKIMWNGSEYTCTGVMYSEDGATNMGVMFGNAGAMIPGAAVTDEPFLFVVIAPELVADIGAYAICVIFDGSTNVMFSANIGDEVIHKIDEKFLPIQKTHWVNEEDIAIYEDVSIDLDENGEGGLIRQPKTEFIPGVTYNVVWDGTEYEATCTATSANDPFYKYYLGVENVFSMQFLQDSLIAQLNGIVAMVGSTATGEAKTILFSATEPVGTVHKLDEKFLPDTIAKTSEINYPVDSVNGKTGAVVLSFSDVGADASGSAASALSSAKSYTDTKISDLINSAPTTLDTLGEIATAMEENADVVEALETAVGAKANAADLTSHTGNKSNPHEVTLSQLGVTATAAELNYVDGVTSAIQTQLNDKVSTSRTVNGKALSSNITLSASDVGADAAGSADAALAEAKAYADEAKRVASNAQSTAQTTMSLLDGKMAKTNPVGSGSFSMGRKADTTIGLNSHAEGLNTTASGNYSHAEGFVTTASGNYSHAEGSSAEAIADGSHAEGSGTTASGTYSHAEGNGTTASGSFSHAEGYVTTASGENSHAEGYETTASEKYSHAEGFVTTASGSFSHAEGSNTTASGNYSHAEGSRTIAASSYQHVQGKNNIEDASGQYAHIVGNGTSSSDRSNAHTLDWSGNGWYQTSVCVGGTDQDVAPTSLAANGLILTDETTGTKYRVYITNAKLTMEVIS